MISEHTGRFLHTLVAEAAIRQPRSVAVDDGDGAWTYAELDEHSRAYAVGLASAGVRPGDRVLIRAVAHRWVLAAIYACSRVGAVAVPLSPDLRPAQWDQITTDAEPTLVLTGPPPPASGPVPKSPASLDQPVLFLYTSGSTALPRAVVCPHRQLLFATAAVSAGLGYRAHDTVLCRLPLSFDYDLYQAFLAASAGATLLLRGSDQDAALLATIRRHQVTVVPVVPSLATMLIRLANREAAAPSVRLITNTDQELTGVQCEVLRRAFPSAIVRLMYGTTECKRVTIAEPDADLTRPGSIEAAARQLPQVADVALLPPRHDQDAVLFTVTALSPQDVLRQLRGRLEPTKVPGKCLILRELPLGSNGKTDRATLGRLADHDAGIGRRV